MLFFLFNLPKKERKNSYAKFRAKIVKIAVYVWKGVIKSAAERRSRKVQLNFIILLLTSIYCIFRLIDFDIDSRYQPLQFLMLHFSSWQSMAEQKNQILFCECWPSMTNSTAALFFKSMSTGGCIIDVEWLHFSAGQRTLTHQRQLTCWQWLMSKNLSCSSRPYVTDMKKTLAAASIISWTTQI